MHPVEARRRDMCQEMTLERVAGHDEKVRDAPPVYLMLTVIFSDMIGGSNR
jgi:hypothetical protein